MSSNNNAAPALAPEWNDVRTAGLPPCDGETLFLGENDNGYAGVFNTFEADDTYYYATAEELVCVLSGLRYWRRYAGPLRQPAASGAGQLQVVGYLYTHPENPGWLSERSGVTFDDPDTQQEPLVRRSDAEAAIAAALATAQAAPAAEQPIGYITPMALEKLRHGTEYRQALSSAEHPQPTATVPVYLQTPAAAQPDLPAVIEQIAQQWDGCEYDGGQSEPDIGKCIRAAGKRLMAEAGTQEAQPHWRHIKTGGTYTELHRGTLQTCREQDMEPVVIYQSKTDSRVWVRPTIEFEDGRFERVTPTGGAQQIVTPGGGLPGDHNGAKAAKAAQPVRCGCHVDLEPGMEPDGCVLDQKRPQDCVYASRLVMRNQGRDACEYWLPITGPAAGATGEQPDPVRAAAQAVIDNLDGKRHGNADDLLEHLRKALTGATGERP